MEWAKHPSQGAAEKAKTTPNTTTRFEAFLTPTRVTTLPSLVKYWEPFFLFFRRLGWPNWSRGRGGRLSFSEVPRAK